MNVRLLTGIAVVAAYLPPLLRSFWVDEAGMFWMARGGPLAAIEKAWHWPGQSILYSAVSSLFAHDRLLRLPAIIGGLLLCWFLYRFAEDAIGKGAGPIAAILAAFHPFTIDFATQARPYTLAMAAVTASCWALYRWVAKAETKWLGGWIAASVLIIYLHYLFALVFAVQVLYLGLHRRRILWPRAILASLVAMAACLPLLPHMRLLFRESGTLPFMPAPRLADLGEILIPTLLLCGLGIVGLFLQRGEGPVLSGRNDTIALVAWWLTGPLLLYLVSTNTTMRMFVPRYLAWSEPALVLLLAGIGYTLFGPQRGTMWAIAAALLTTASPLQLLTLRNPGPEELGPFMSLIRQEGPQTPVIFTSELPESNAYNWKSGNSPDSYLFAPFAAYPMPNRLVPLPKRISDDAKAYLHEIIPADLAHSTAVLLVTRDPAWVPLIATEFEKHHFTYNWTQPNNFYVVRFTRPQQ